jgi:hypothetical protein
MKKEFDFEEFNEFMFFEHDKSVFEKGHIQTKDISDWLECSIRLVQKWGKKNNVPFHRIKGIKHYIWIDETLEEFEKWYNRNLNKQKKSYYKPKPKRECKPKPVKKEISFITLKDIVLEINTKNKFKEYEISINTQMRYIQRWCKYNKIQFENIYGRKYYKITSDIKTKIIEIFEPKFNSMVLDYRLYKIRYEEDKKLMDKLEKEILERN